MSHFPVIVCLPASTDDIDAALNAALAPYDEGLEVETYVEDGEEYGHNPDAKWDWWVIGGRWTGYFPVKVAASAGTTRLGRPGVFGNAAPQGTVDFGPKSELDLEGMRATAQAKAEADWGTYHEVIAGTPNPKTWAEFVARVEESDETARQAMGGTRRELIIRSHVQAGAEVGVEVDSDGYPIGGSENPKWTEWEQRDKAIWRTLDAEWNAALTYTIDQARREYGAQARVQAVRNSAHYREAFFYDPIDEIGPYTRDKYADRERAGAVPGFAALLLDGTWVEPGRMGWFGMSSDTHSTQDAYRERINQYIDDLPDDAFLVAVDCHI